VANVRKELAALLRALAGLEPAPTPLEGLKRELRAINEALWDIENRTRAKEAAKTFDQKFIELTRSVYLNNDKRAGIKRRINELLNSGLIEEKQYTAYKGVTGGGGVYSPIALTLRFGVHKKYQDGLRFKCALCQLQTCAAQVSSTPARRRLQRKEQSVSGSSRRTGAVPRAFEPRRIQSK
jgi:hypothetical protein